MKRRKQEKKEERYSQPCRDGNHEGLLRSQDRSFREPDEVDLAHDPVPLGRLRLE